MSIEDQKHIMETIAGRLGAPLTEVKGEGIRTTGPKSDLEDFVIAQRGGMKARMIVIWKRIPKKIKAAVMGGKKKMPWADLAKKAEEYLSQKESHSDGADSLEEGPFHKLGFSVLLKGMRRTVLESDIINQVEESIEAFAEEGMPEFKKIWDKMSWPYKEIRQLEDLARKYKI